MDADTQLLSDMRDSLRNLSADLVTRLQRTQGGDPRQNDKKDQSAEPPAWHDPKSQVGSQIQAVENFGFALGKIIPDFAQLAQISEDIRGVFGAWDKMFGDKKVEESPANDLVRANEVGKEFKPSEEQKERKTYGDDLQKSLVQATAPPSWAERFDERNRPMEALPIEPLSWPVQEQGQRLETETPALPAAEPLQWPPTVTSPAKEAAPDEPLSWPPTAQKEPQNEVQQLTDAMNKLQDEAAIAAPAQTLPEVLSHPQMTESHWDASAPDSQHYDSWYSTPARKSEEPLEVEDPYESPDALGGNDLAEAIRVLAAKGGEDTRLLERILNAIELQKEGDETEDTEQLPRPDDDRSGPLQMELGPDKGREERRNDFEGLRNLTGNNDKKGKMGLLEMLETIGKVGALLKGGG